jgi:Flp pilus assembly pilin Flp
LAVLQRAQPLKQGGTVYTGKEIRVMRDLVSKSLQRLHRDESGQGLVEYLLILALVAFACIAGMQALASGINSAFTKVGSIIGQYIS